MINIKKSLGENIQSLRLKKDYSIADLQYLLFHYEYRVSRKSIYRWEKDKTIPDLRAIVILCDIYKISVPTLLQIKEENKTSTITKYEREFIFALRTNKTFRKVLNKIIKKEDDTHVKSWKQIKDFEKGE